MTRSAIRAEHLSKRYRLGLTHHGSLRELVNRSWRGLAGRAARVPDTRPHDEADHHRTRDGHFWALQDVSFEVQPGEVIGIVGENGAGKSTLLKILSRITRPTAGRVTLRGRVASLLEVGTGFHPELTGRENVYMNGTILGMTRREINRRFDAIVAFAGVESFIDTPVKRYSSGMTVRLGFAVAAHLDPEILIVDEVLAVGDSGFQRKCADAMQAIRSSGRSIILVSHNMMSIRTLCTRCLLLSQGEVIDSGDAATISQRYLSDRTRDLATEATFAAGAGSDRLPRLRAAGLRADGLSGGMLPLGSELQIALQCQTSFPGDEVYVGYVISDVSGTAVLNANNRYQVGTGVILPEAEGEVVLDLGAVPLMPGTYTCSFWIGDRLRDQNAYEHVLKFEVVPRDVWGTGIMPPTGSSPLWWSTGFRHASSAATQEAIGVR